MIPDFDYQPPDVPLDILFQDDLIIVAHKPAGLLSVPGKLEGRSDCLVSRLTAAHWDTLLVHRLDCDTSGVMMPAPNRPKGFWGKSSKSVGRRRPMSPGCLGKLRVIPAT